MAKPPKGEIAPNYQAGMTLYTEGLMQNPDPIIGQRGGSVSIYDELLRDDQVAPCFDQRRRAVTHSEWFVDAASDSAADKAAADDLREQLERIHWDDITDKMLYGLIHGYGVAEILWGNDGQRVIIDQIKVRDRKRFRFDRDLNLTLVDPGDHRGKRMPARKFWTFSVGSDTSDNPYGRGIGHQLYWPCFFKRNAIKFWMIYLDKFAQPTAVGKIPNSMRDDQEQLNEILQMLDAIQTDSAVTIPEEVQAELMEATRSGTPDYNTVTERMDKAIAKIILSQTMTNDNGSSRSQAEVHKDVRDEVVKGDADLICDSFNQSVVAWLTEYNHPGAQPPRVWRKTEPEEDLESRAERDKKILSLGFEPTEDYIRETYGEGWVRRQAKTAPPQEQGPLPEDFTEISDLAEKRVAHRADQQRLKDAAKSLAQNYPDLYGERVQQLLEFLDDSDDAETFKQRLAAMMEEPPNERAVDTVRNATTIGRLMGMFRGQR